MAANQSPWPSEWLMTDERIDERLWDAIDALPAGAGIVFRHYAASAEERAGLAHKVAQQCRTRGLILAVARDVVLADSLGAALVHNPAGASSNLPISRSAHSLQEAQSACAAGASLIFLSPIFPTRSHPDRPALSRAVARRIIGACGTPVIALGGMNRARFAERKGDGFYGWAGIDAWLGD